MSRDDGFPIADVDVGLLRDVKLRRLRAEDPDDWLAATLLYIAVILSSWEEGFRLSALVADSPVEATPDRVAALVAAGLLDDDAKVPVHAWTGWFRPAWERRDSKRRGGAKGNRRRWHPDMSESDSDSETESDTESETESESESGSDTESESESDTESPSVPSVPSVPTGPSVPRARARRTKRGDGNDATTDARDQPKGSNGTSTPPAALGEIIGRLGGKLPWQDEVDS